MTQPPLNPDGNLPASGVEAAARALYFADAHESVSPDGWPDFDSPWNTGKDRYYEVSHEVVRAYLAAALPEVTSVEELEALPDRSVVLDADGAACQRNGFGMDGNCWDSMGEEMLSRHIPLPARVLYRPEVKP